jgi:hypothetical protein
VAGGILGLPRMREALLLSPHFLSGGLAFKKSSDSEALRGGRMAGEGKDSQDAAYGATPRALAYHIIGGAGRLSAARWSARAAP